MKKDTVLFLESCAYFDKKAWKSLLVLNVVVQLYQRHYNAVNIN